MREYKGNMNSGRRLDSDVRVSGEFTLVGRVDAEMRRSGGNGRRARSVALRPLPPSCELDRSPAAIGRYLYVVSPA